MTDSLTCNLDSRGTATIQLKTCRTCWNEDTLAAVQKGLNDATCEYFNTKCKFL